jgi:hypothetical protein
MPLRLSRLIRSIASATDPRGVLDALQKRAEPLNVLTIGTLDNHSNAFFHDSVPVKYRQDYLTSLRQHGEGPMSRYAKIEPLPFTFTEARQKLKPIGRDNWAFDLLNDYEIRDGYIVPHGNWAVLFWSERVLRNVSHETRLA